MFAVYALGAALCTVCSFAVEAPGVALIFAGATVALLLAHVFWVRHLAEQVKGLIGRNEEAVGLIAQGQVEEAVRVLEGLIDSARTLPVNHSIFVLNRAIARTKMGELDEAFAHLSAVAAGRCLEPALYKAQCATLYSQLAFVSALRGDVTAGGRWLAGAQARIAPRLRPSLIAYEAILEARKGNFSTAAAKLEGGWSEAEAVLSAAQMKPIAILRAFFLSTAFPDGSREAEVVGLLASAKGVRPNAYVYVAHAWPELAAFHQKHGLESPPTLTA
jgi:hypothetical protein